ncbi:hypothetical protein QV65_30640 [Rhodococcus erythropolis]|nr:hypothetical protein QV65_30640 [Rhodococcus erythropolis]
MTLIHRFETRQSAQDRCPPSREVFRTVFFPQLVQLRRVAVCDGTLECGEDPCLLLRTQGSGVPGGINLGQLHRRRSNPVRNRKDLGDGNSCLSIIGIEVAVVGVACVIVDIVVTRLYRAEQVARYVVVERS